MKHQVFHKEKSSLKFEKGFSIVFAAILLSQFSPCPGITMATDDVITATDDVITATDEVIHIICIDLEGKLICCKKIAVFMTTNSLLKFYFLELLVEILMQQFLLSNQKICCWSKFLCTIKLFHQNRFLATILQNDRPRRSLL